MSVLFHKKRSAGKNGKNGKTGGFTLVEIMVALGVFTIVAVVAMGAFLKIIDANKKSQTLKTAINNINFALESMSREMRVGSMYTCSGGLFTGGQDQFDDPSDRIDCDFTEGNGDVHVAFLSSKRGTGSGIETCNLIHAYALVETSGGSGMWALEKAEQTNCDSDIDSDDYVPVISPDAVIDGFNLKVENLSGGSDVTPRAFFRLKGYSGVRETTRTVYDVQTSVSQRIPF